jgi:hypothetical protein
MAEPLLVMVGQYAEPSHSNVDPDQYVDLIDVEVALRAWRSVWSASNAGRGDASTMFRLADTSLGV